MQLYSRRRGFTLVELLAVVAVIAILAVVVVLTLNPVQLIKQGRDANRVSDMTTLNKAISLYYEDAINQPSTLFMGTSSVIYLSIPDPTATSSAGTNCAGLGLGLPSTGYHCPAPSTYRNTNGTGWIPIDFASSTIGSSIATLSVDPINTTSSGEYYEYETDAAGNWQIISTPESQKYSSLSSDFSGGTTSSLLGALNVTYTTTTYALNGVSSPYYGAFDSNTNTIWVGGHTSLAVINDTTEASTTFAMQCPYFMAFDNNTNNMWIGNCDTYDTVTQMNDTTYATSTYYVGTYPYGIAFDPNNNSIWAVNISSPNYQATEFNDTTYATTTYAIPAGAYDIAFDSHTNTMWTTNQGNDTVTQINVATGATSTYPAGGYAYDIAFDSHTNTIWVTDNTGVGVEEINDTTYATTTFGLGSGFGGVAFDPHTDSVWVAAVDTVTSTKLIEINDTTYATTTYTIPHPDIYGIIVDSHNNSIWGVQDAASGTVTEFVPNH